MTKEALDSIIKNNFGFTYPVERFTLYSQVSKCMQEYADQLLLSKESEIKRLREALEKITHVFGRMQGDEDAMLFMANSLYEINSIATEVLGNIKTVKQ